MFNMTFRELYKAGKEFLKNGKEGLVKNQNERAFDAAIDYAKSETIDKEGAIMDELSVVGEGKVIDVNRILQLSQEIEDAKYTIKTLESIKEKFFSDNPTLFKEEEADEK